MNLPEAFLSRMRSTLGGESFNAYLKAMEEPPKRSGRINTLKTDAQEFAALSGISPDGVDFFTLPEGRAPGSDPLHQAGLYYMQESSARYPVSLFSIESGMTVLDLCAAPGGKSGQLAQRLSGTGLLVSNELVPSRARILESNLERLGVTNVVITNTDAETLVNAAGPCFDCVLVDAPCAGEGMFRKDPDAVQAWSPEHVESCALRQRKLLLTAAEAVKPGGQLVYSTCSFSPDENGHTVQDFLAHRPDFTLVSEKTLYPHTSDGEGQFAALLVRDGALLPTPLYTQKSAACREWEAFSPLVSLPVEGSVSVLKDGRVLYLPPLPGPSFLSGVRIVRSGILLGECVKGRFDPAHALAMAGRVSPLVQKAELTAEEAVKYLRGETLETALSSWCAVTLSGHALGLGKGAGGILKNHLPKGLRIK